MSSKHWLICLLFIATTLSLAVPAQQSNAPATAPDRKAAPAKHSAGQQEESKQGEGKDDEGQRIFEQNCSRCHTAPEGFSPRISGTIVRHMRVRASLSEHDEREILRFLNP